MEGEIREEQTVEPIRTDEAGNAIVTVKKNGVRVVKIDYSRTTPKKDG